MNTPRTTSYLEGRVRTASQPQLHLMLIEGAIKFGQLARKMWSSVSTRSEGDLQFNAMLDIVEELAQSAARGTANVSKQLEEQYAFLFRELAACLLDRDLEKLESCLKLLDYQRETWKMACEWQESQAQTLPASTTVSLPQAPFTSAGGFSIEA